MANFGFISRDPTSGELAPSAPRDKAVPPIMTAAEIAALAAHPRFTDARQVLALGIIEDHTANRLLNRVFNDRGRFVIGMFAQYLHHFRLDGESEAGLTAARLRALCARTGISSPGRATALLGLMRFAGYLSRAPRDRVGSDRRQRLLVPTARLVALQRQRWLRQLTALSLITPEGARGRELLGQAWFERALLGHMVRPYLGGFRFVDQVPELARYIERNGCLLILAKLALPSGAAPASSAPPPTISGLSSEFGVSRAHIRNLLEDAAADGFVERPAGLRQPIVVRPALVRAVDRFFATGLAYAAHCVRLALAEHG